MSPAVTLWLIGYVLHKVRSNRTWTVAFEQCQAQRLMKAYYNPIQLVLWKRLTNAKVVLRTKTLLSLIEIGAFEHQPVTVLEIFALLEREHQDFGSYQACFEGLSSNHKRSSPKTLLYVMEAAAELHQWSIILNLFPKIIHPSEEMVALYHTARQEEEEEPTTDE